MKMRNRYISMLLCIIMVLGLLPAHAFAADIVASGYCGGEGDGTNLTWTLNSEGVLTISGTGKMEDYDSYGGMPWAAYKSSLTELIVQYGVSSIGDLAFRDFYCLSSLTIPNSVTSIGYSAFNGCIDLTGDLVIPNSVTRIGAAAFESCSGFSGTLLIPDSVTSIGEYAFFGCNGFKGDLFIPDTVTEIGEGAFWDCKGFTGELHISNSISSIDYATFAGCDGFTGSLVIPNSVVSIGLSAFVNCSGFSDSLIIPKSVVSIEKSAFYNCIGLDDIYFEGNAPTAINATSPNRSFEKGAKLYYVVGKSGWTDSDVYDPDAGTWNGYKLETWDGPAFTEQAPPEDETPSISGSDPYYATTESRLFETIPNFV